jgi:hypothetical protein
VAGCCEHCDEPSGSGATELVGFKGLICSVKVVLIDRKARYCLSLFCLRALSVSQTLYISI